MTFVSPRFSFKLRTVYLSAGTALVCQVACLDRPISTGEVDELTLLARQPISSFSSTDLLLVVDDSASMADKQRVFAKTLRRTLGQTVCIGKDGQLVDVEANGATDEPAQCSTLGDGVRIGVITTSLERGGTHCGSAEAYGRLRPLPDGSVHFERGEFDETFEAWIAGIGENGCSYEAPLEAAYRFLIDPEPLRAGEESSVSDAGVGVLDDALLEERHAFLRPGSAVIVVFLTDEDDCSVAEVNTDFQLDTATLAPGTSACETDSLSACCRPCDTVESAPPDGCAPLGEDARCLRGFEAAEDASNLRCFNQRQRFGQELLFPIERYVRGFTQPTVPNRSAEEVANPLFSHGRTPDMVKVAGLVGVPWQLIAADVAGDTSLTLLTPMQLREGNIWSRLLGNAADVHMWPSINPRPGLAAPDSGYGADPIHGHEFDNPHYFTPQYACTFSLPEPLECADSDRCDCSVFAWEDDSLGPSSPNNPVCQAPDGTYGTLQYSAKAYPAPRLLQMLQQVEGYVGSICPKSLEAAAKNTSAYGYTALFRELVAWLGTGNEAGVCLEHAFPVEKSERDKCRLLERLPAGSNCDLPSRRVASAEDKKWTLPPGASSDAFTVCEVDAASGDQELQGTQAYSCAHDFSPMPLTLGYCFIDPAHDLGSPELVAMCEPSRARRVRVVPPGLGRSAEEMAQQGLFLVCR